MVLTGNPISSASPVISRSFVSIEAKHTDSMQCPAIRLLLPNEVRCIHDAMPRRPTHRHIMRDLRHTIRKTQAEFALMAGVKPITINRIENGSIKRVSAELAVRIHVATGISV